MELGGTTIEKSVIPEMEGERKCEVMQEEGDHHGSACCLEKKARREAGCHCL